MSESDTTANDDESNKSERDGKMRDPEFWQRIALEAIVNDDAAKALSLRIEASFSGTECIPRQKDTLRVVGNGYGDLFNWMVTPEFEFAFETIEEDDRGVLVRGIEFTQFEDEFSTGPENADEELGPDSVQGAYKGKFVDKDGNRWKFIRDYISVPTALDSHYQSRIFADREDGEQSEEMRPQTFADRVEDGTYTLVEVSE